MHVCLSEPCFCFENCVQQSNIPPCSKILSYGDFMIVRCNATIMCDSAQGSASCNFMLRTSGILLPSPGVVSMATPSTMATAPSATRSWYETPRSLQTHCRLSLRSRWIPVSRISHVSMHPSGTCRCTCSVGLPTISVSHTYFPYEFTAD